MATLFGWAWKISLGALIYVGFQGGLDLKVPDRLKHSIENGSKKISDTLGR